MESTPHKRKRGGQFCSAINCTNCRTKPECTGLSFFYLPSKDEERCRRWIQLMRRQDLVGKTMAQIKSSGASLCADHFEPNQFNVPSERKRLVFNAVPTIFNVPNPPASVTLKRKLPCRVETERPSSKQMCTKGDPGTSTSDSLDLEIEDHITGDKTMSVVLKKQLKASQNKLYRAKQKLCKTDSY